MMRKFKRVIHRHFGGVGNFCAILALVILTAIFLNINVLSKRHTSIHMVSVTSVVDHQNYILSANQTVQSTDQSGIKLITWPLTPDLGCEIEEKCPENAFPFKVVSGDGLNKYPVICFNNRLLVDKSLKDSKIGRGLNVVIVDGQTFGLKSIETFDTYVEESFLIRTLRWNMKDGDIILMASYDEISYSLKESSWSLLEKHGSQMIRSIKFRDAFAMLGQRGLTRGKAIEMHQPKGSRDFASAAHISGCAKFPLGPIIPVPSVNADIKKDGNITIGASVKNCGLAEKCKDNEFAVHVYTGKDNNDEPKICVDGKYVIARGINDAGRGINIAVVANGKEVIRTGHFDTWQDDSTNLEIFLENLEDNVILIAITFDEASLKLSQHSRNLFFDLGSATIQNLKYRDVWVLIGQKGIKGFSPYEEISYTGPGTNYATLINKRMCVPQTIKGNKIRPDPIPFRNDRRRDFCSRHDGYGDFCSDINVDKSLEPVPLINKTLEENTIYSTPILVIAGISHNSLRMCLETILMQPGLNVENVLVAVDEKFSEPLALVDLFKFRGQKITSSANYLDHYEQSLKTVWEIFPSKSEVIVIEEDLILSPDFLYTLALLSDVFRKDETLNVIQLWNPNSYDAINGSIELIYRIDQFFGLGYLIKRSFYDEHIKNSFKNCCSKRVWDQWNMPTSFSALMPDVSRVFRRPVDGVHPNVRYVDALFNVKRKTSLNPFPALSNIETLRKDRYDMTVKHLIEQAISLQSIEHCSTINDDIFQTLRNSQRSNQFKMIYSQSNVNDFTSLTSILTCFGLFSEAPLGLYQGLLRFHSNQNEIYLIGSKSLLNPTI